MAEAVDSAHVAHVVEHLFRHEAGRLVSILVRRFGPPRLELAEDAVQDALSRAMQAWPLAGVPANPTAWLLQTARNRLLDHARREMRWRDREAELSPLLEDCLRAALQSPAPQFEDEVRDSQLRMMFVCCHPGLPPETQVALTLKTLCGFGEREIAAALLTREVALTKRLVRARRHLRESGIGVELPPAVELEPRLNQVRHVLYLLFNEGYKASQGDHLLRADLCAEAIRLGELLVSQPVGRQPETHALLALMYFNHARFTERLNQAGELQVLAAQDRSRWEKQSLAAGARHLSASTAGEVVTRLHLEAGIAACHTLAPDEASTNWWRIRELYDQLLALDPSPIVALNRAVAIARCAGADAGLAALGAIPNRQALARNHLFHAVSAEFRLATGDRLGAAENLRRALALATIPVERNFLQRRLDQCAD